MSDAGVHVLFTRIKPHIMATFKRSHLCGDIEEACFHRDPAQAFAHAWELIQAEREAQSASPDDPGSQSDDEQPKAPEASKPGRVSESVQGTLLPPGPEPRTDP